MLSFDNASGLHGGDNARCGVSAKARKDEKAKAIRSTPVLLPFYSNPTRFLLQSYSHPAPTLLEVMLEKVPKPRGKQRILPLREHAKKKIGRVK